MSLETISRRYTQALYELGVEGGNLSSLTDEVSRLGQAYSTSAELRTVLSSPLVNEGERDSLLKELSQRLSLSPSVRNLLLLLVNRRRVVLLPLIARDLVKLADEKSSVLRAMVVTAVQLPESFFSRLRAELERQTGSKVTLEHSVDPSLLGGIITRIGDRVIDGSIRTSLERLKNAAIVA